MEGCEDFGIILSPLGDTARDCEAFVPRLPEVFSFSRITWASCGRSFRGDSLRMDKRNFSEFSASSTIKKALSSKRNRELFWV